MPSSKKTLIKRLRLASTNVPFVFNDEIYNKFEGMAMGSNLAPTFASFAMNLIEHKISFLPIEQQPLFLSLIHI